MFLFVQVDGLIRVMQLSIVLTLNTGINHNHTLLKFVINYTRYCWKKMIICLVYLNKTKYYLIKHACLDDKLLSVVLITLARIVDKMKSSTYTTVMFLSSHIPVSIDSYLLNVCIQQRIIQDYKLFVLDRDTKCIGVIPT